MIALLKSSRGGPAAATSLARCLLLGVQGTASINSGRRGSATATLAFEIKARTRTDPRFRQDERNIVGALVITCNCSHH
jgi:hypothetical protein